MSNANYPVNSVGSAAFAATVSAFVFAFLVPICSADGVIEPAVVAVLAGIFVEMSRRHAIRKLVASLNATDAHAFLDVYINGAQVGTIASTDVISLKLEALRDPRNYAAQFLNIVGVAARGTLAALILVPLMLFWAYVVSAWVFPASLQTAISIIAPLQPADLARVAIRILYIAQIVFMLVIASSLTFGVDLGLANVFRNAVHRRIRLKINCASDGTLHFVPATRTVGRIQPA
ncbi:hypothetical protein PQQ65_29630 [Paraburkholderia strydomiana]|uniref:hypothetical protein n=1 Tax=Paraburkholderia strydomiana TaxID=1245417 RepID=UPI0038BA20B0